MRICYFLLFLCLVENASAQEKLEIYFDFNKTDINPKTKIKLDSLITSKNKIEILKIYGFTDSVDTTTYNDSLSIKRAKKIFNYCKENKVQISNQVEIKGFGENYNQSKNSNKNRKAIIFFKSILSDKPKPNPNNSENGSFYSSENPEILKQFLASEKSIFEKFKNAKKGDIIVINNILFQINSEKLANGSSQIIIDLLDYLTNNPKIKIEIHGNICCNPNTNDVKLSYRRAKYIFDYLIKNGIATSRLGYHGYGSANPIYKIPEKSYQEELANRRVEILIIEK
ncbi:OmpA family protein [Flavobacterium psychrophilum]|uniref:OmpA family protein n=1 Tax=Flavobacterium psychrophilum TaxID=96345 RepID=UPI000B7C2D6E|nr:OmpA family protein [Flavobacterium psychrophilum]ELY1980053.1 OmpA family protein [Flavobacterium psychrophilum]SNB11906.1 putative outer membrane protein, OmpA family [Flavobacterium psychrophilum]